jgi:hypothetical protein
MCLGGYSLVGEDVKNCRGTGKQGTGGGGGRKAEVMSQWSEVSRQKERGVRGLNAGIGNGGSRDGIPRL